MWMARGVFITPLGELFYLQINIINKYSHLNKAACASDRAALIPLKTSAFIALQSSSVLFERRIVSR